MSSFLAPHADSIVIAIENLIRADRCYDARVRCTSTQILARRELCRGGDSMH
jgi:hypothetical protein